MSGFGKKITRVLPAVASFLGQRDWRMATAESCTGGWIAKCCTDAAGSSAWFDRAYVVYSYEAKEQMLGISQHDLLKYGAVSEEIACQMAQRAKQLSKVAVTVSATGIAGPGGGMPGKPVGLVHFAWCINEQPVSADSAVFPGNRKSVRQQTVLHALEGILFRLQDLG